MRVTLKDVAKKAGVSKATASMVLSGRAAAASISQETAERVLEAAKELNYYPHLLARAVATGRTYTLGVISSGSSDVFSSDYCSRLMRGVANVAHERGYNLMIFDDEVMRRVNPSMAYAGLVAGGQVDGVVILTWDMWPERLRRELRTLAKADCPTVCLGRKPPGIQMDSVGVDNVKGGERATEHLLELGHEKIGVITLGEDSLSSHERLEGYKTALSRRGIPFRPEYVRHSSLQSPKAGELLDYFRGLPEPPTAVFALYDPLALSFISAMKERGLRVPGDMSVMGFGNIELAAHASPALTTLDEPLEEIGKKGAKLLLDRIEGYRHADPPRYVVLQAELVQRDSCAAATPQSS